MFNLSRENKTIARVMWEPPAGINLHELMKYTCMILLMVQSRLLDERFGCNVKGQI